MYTVKRGYLLAFRGNEDHWVIDVLVGNEEGKSTVYENGEFDVDKELYRLSRGEWVLVDKDGYDESLGQIMVHNVGFISGDESTDQYINFNVLMSENMVSDAGYRMVYLTDEEFQNSLWIRCEGVEMSQDEDNNYMGKIEIKMKGIHGEGYTNFREVEEIEKRELGDEIFEGVLRESVRMVLAIDEMYCL